MLKIIPVLLLIFLYASSYSQTKVPGSDTLKMILRNTFSTVKQNSVYRSKVDWVDLEYRVFDQIDSLNSYEDLVTRVSLIFKTIGDNHGALFLNGKRIGKNDSTPIIIREPLKKPFKKRTPPVRTELLQNKFGYILVNGNRYGDNIRTIGQNIQDSLCKLNPAKLPGIIIDLRLNEGGSIYPLFTGLHQLIGNGTVGAFTDINGNATGKWILKKGKYYQYNRIVASVKNKCKCSKDIKVAILLSQITASAGEDLAIAFKGRPNTIFIGEKTYGLTTANSTFQINGHLLAVASSFTADRTGKVYDGAILPDIEITEGDNFENLLQDTKILEAISWFTKD